MDEPRPNERRQLIEIADRVGPSLHEYFDAFLIMGVSAGNIETGMHITVAHSEQEQIAVENMVLMVAQHIVEQRGRRNEAN